MRYLYKQKTYSSIRTSQISIIQQQEKKTEAKQKQFSMNLALQGLGESN